MLTATFRVISCGEIEQLTKQDGDTTYKRQLRIQELGGFSRYDNPAQNVGNAIQATMFGNMAQNIFYPNDIVQVCLKFNIRNVNGLWYQDITIVDVIKINKPYE